MEKRNIRSRVRRGFVDKLTHILDNELIFLRKLAKEKTQSPSTLSYFCHLHPVGVSLLSRCIEPQNIHLTPASLNCYIRTSYILIIYLGVTFDTNHRVALSTSLVARTRICSACRTLVLPVRAITSFPPSFAYLIRYSKR